MRVSIKNITFFTLITLITFAATTQAQVRAYRVSDRQVQTLLTRIENSTDTFKNQIDRNLDNSNIDGTGQEDSINTIISNFENATDRLKNNFSSNRSSANDVQDVLQRAAFINSFVQNNRLSTTVQRTWISIRTDLNTLAGYYRVSANWNAPVITLQNVYTGSDMQVRNVIAQIESRTNNFKRQIGRNLNNSTIDGTNREDSINTMVSNFESATNRLKNNFSSRRSTTNDVQEVLNRAVSINSFVANNRLSNPAENSWNQIRTDLNTLAGYYRVSSNWDNTVVTPGGGRWGNGSGSFDSRLTGTYRLNTQQSDDIARIVDQAIRASNNSGRQDERMRRNLERRLMSPETLTFEKRGQQVTFGSGNTQSVVMTADGRRQTETSPNGRSVTTSVTATGRELTISYEGDRMNDYNVSFMPSANGQLTVTRRIYLENQSTTVTAKSVYDKTGQTADWNTSNFPANGGGNRPMNGYIVPNNTNILATLDSPLSTRTAKNGDRFSMTVTSPSQYNGAVIEGNVVGEQSGVVTGRANMSLSFNTIRMRNGVTHAFTGIVNEVRNTNGDIVRVDNEGQVSDSSQTNKTVTRAGIGAILGGIIGAIAGGGSGSAIGAGVGAGAGAGTVVLQGRDNLELATGSQFTITASAPANVGRR